jgi:hypothetical protein
MSEGVWHERAKKNLVSKYGDLAECSHGDASLLIYSGKVSPKNLILSFSVLVTKTTLFLKNVL